MKKFFLFFLGLGFSFSAYSVGLLEVYKDAAQNDQIYKQAEAHFLSDKELLPKALSYLLPQFSIIGNGSENWDWGSNAGNYVNVMGNPNHSSTKFLSYGYSLQATQTLFSWSTFSAYQGAHDSVNQAAATFAYAAQELMVRVAQAYFSVLQAQETLLYAKANQATLESQLNAAKQRYKVGLDAITAVYQAQAAYDSARAARLAQENALVSAKEDLRVITNKDYSDFSKLKENFPLIMPNPTNINIWMKAAVEKNFNLKASRYSVLVAQENIRAQEGAHYPVLNLKASYGTTIDQLQGGSLEHSPLTPSLVRLNSGTQTDTVGTLGLNLNFNAFNGGLISSNVRQAQAQSQLANAAMEQTYRQTIAGIRKYYLSVISTLSQVEADKQAVKSGQAALRNIKAGYKVGTQTMTDMLQQQGSLYQMQTTYAQDRFKYVLTTLQLKQAAGSLTIEDIIAINGWLL